MKIKVTWEVNTFGGQESFSLDDLGLTKEDWDSMDYGSKIETLNGALWDLPEPRCYPVVDSFLLINEQ